VNWRPAVLLSGILESVVALIALVYWYSYSVTHWAADAVFAAIQNGAQIDPRAIGFAGDPFMLRENRVDSSARGAA
jgi:type IV secretory pathway TrbD component